jgi:uncharacterized protein DUF3592
VKRLREIAGDSSASSIPEVSRRAEMDIYYEGSFRRLKTTMGTVQKGPLIWLGLMALVLLFGLCTVFASVVTVVQAWQERAQARWPEVTARVEECGLRRTSTGRRENFYIRCRLSYVAGAEQYATNIYSRSVPSREVSQYPPNQIAPFEEWVNDHPQGTPIIARYDPANPTKIVLVAAHMPGGGPRTPTNVKLLEFLAGSFLILGTIARITRPRTFWHNPAVALGLKP